MSLATAYSSSRGRRSLTKWSPSILSSPTIGGSRTRSGGGGSAPGSVSRSQWRRGGGALAVARRGGGGGVFRVPATAGPPPPGRRGPRPPPGRQGEGGKSGTTDRRMVLADTRGSGDAHAASWTSRDSLLMRLARNTRDPDLRRRCRAVVALEPYRSAHTIFSPEGQRAYLQLRERVLHAVGKSLEEEKDSKLTLPVLDQDSVNRILELQGDVQIEEVIGDKTANAVFKDMDEKLRAIQPAKRLARRESASILKSLSPTRSRNVVDTRRPTSLRRRVSFLEGEDEDDEGEEVLAGEVTIRETYNRALTKWKEKHKKRLSRKSREAGGGRTEEGKLPPITPSNTSTTTNRLSRTKDRTRSLVSSRRSVRKASEMTIAFLYEGEAKDTSSEEEDRERRRRNWKGLGVEGQNK